MLAVLLLNQMNAASAKHRISDRDTSLKSRKNRKNSPKDAYCRTCLTTDDLGPIFHNKIDEGKRSNDLKLVTGLQIRKNDGLSQKMCCKCNETMSKALQFRKTCKKSEKLLLHMFPGTKLKKKPSKLQRNLLKEVEIKDVTAEDDEDMKLGDNIFGDYFQNEEYFDNEYNDIEETVVKKEKQPSTAKKRTRTPNATSYKCATCNKEFKMKATYKAHMRFHTNYCVCESCGKRCRNNNQLQEHKRARHGLGRIHKCAYCEYSSATKEALTIHERRHTGERPYICDHCGATFHRRSNLVQHIAIHLPEKNFQCALCSKLEKSHKRLQIHVYNRHRLRELYRFICPLCPKTYLNVYHVRRHLSRGHGIPRDKQGRVERRAIEALDISTIEHH